MKKIFTQNPITSYKQFKVGMSQLTQGQLLKAKMQGHYWAVVGLIWGLAFMIFRGIGFFSVFVLALIWLQWHDYRAMKQSYENYLQLQQTINEGDASKKYGGEIKNGN